MAEAPVYEAAVFPLTPSGVSEAEEMARCRVVAYQLAVHAALPDTVRVAAAALEAIDVRGIATAPGPR